MSVIDIISIVLSAIAIVLLVGVIFVITRRKSGVNDNFNTNLAENLNAIQKEIDALSNKISDTNEMLIKSQSIKLDGITDKIATLTNTLSMDINRNLSDIKESNIRSLIENKDANTESLNKTRELLEKKFDSIQREVGNNLDRLNTENQKKLDDMQKIIDEKLQTALEKRITESFKIINNQMDALNKSIGEVQSLSGDVKRFNNILSGTKQMGNWGEVMLESLIDQILSPDQYYKQYNISDKNQVDFAIRMPGKGDKEVILPIDCKFPVAKYEAVLTAEANGDYDGATHAKKELINFVKTQATDIKNKYIKLPKTTDFAIMYLPTESLFAEVIKTPGIVQDIQNNSKIVICGPTTISALLNSLQLGFKTLVMQKSSAEIFKTLTTFKKDFAMFDGILEATRKNAEKIIKDMDDGDKRTRLIADRLGKLDKYEPDKLLGGIDEE